MEKDGSRYSPEGAVRPSATCKVAESRHQKPSTSGKASRRQAQTDKAGMETQTTRPIRKANCASIVELVRMTPSATVQQIAVAIRLAESTNCRSASNARSRPRESHSVLILVSWLSPVPASGSFSASSFLLTRSSRTGPKTLPTTCSTAIKTSGFMHFLSFQTVPLDRSMPLTAASMHRIPHQGIRRDANELVRKEAPRPAAWKNQAASVPIPPAALSPGRCPTRAARAADWRPRSRPAARHRRRSPARFRPAQSRKARPGCLC